MRNIIVLDVETAKSAEDCRHCGREQPYHLADGLCGVVIGFQKHFEPIGWDNHAALGLAIGGYYDYSTQRIHWFDEHTLEETMRHFVETRPLMVSFNGMSFDFSLLCALLIQRANALQGSLVPLYEGERSLAAGSLMALCKVFNLLASQSYDILAEIWKADPIRKFERGLNSLDAISQANGLGAKLSHGAHAPRDWAAGRYADVINYCADDVYKTKALFELLQTHGGWIKRGDGQWIDLLYVDRHGELCQPYPLPPPGEATAMDTLAQ